MNPGKKPKREWTQARWFLVDADTAGAPDARSVEVSLQDPEGNKLNLTRLGRVRCWARSCSCMPAGAA